MALGRDGPGRTPALAYVARGSSLRTAPKAPVAGRPTLVSGVRLAPLAIIMPTSTAQHSTGQSGGGAAGLCASARAAWQP